MNDDRFRPLLAAHQRLAEIFLKRRHVIACGIGYKIINGELTNIPSLVVSVDRKAPRIDLSEDDIIPASINDVETDVIETGEIRALGFNRASTVRPVRPGVSIAHIDGSAGTAGCLVRRDDELFMLTNNHVAALIDEGEIGDPILQPGPDDGGQLADTFGRLADYRPITLLLPEVETMGIEAASQTTTDEPPAGCAALIATLFGRQATSPNTLEGSQTVSDDAPSMVRVNRVDAALVSPLESVTLDPRIIDLGAPPSGIAAVGLGDEVIKSGRTSGLTQGQVIQINVTVDVAYKKGKARYTNQVMATPFSLPGDSGSLVLDLNRFAVGLLFSGSETVSVFTPISDVLQALDVNLVT